KEGHLDKSQDKTLLARSEETTGGSGFVKHHGAEDRPNRRHVNLHILPLHWNFRRSGEETAFDSIVFNDKKYNKTWLLNTLQKASSVPFTPLKFFSHGTQVHFFVNDPIAAEALKAASKTLKARDNIKVLICLKAKPMLSAVLMEHNCMQKRYDRSQKAMDLKALRSDSDLVANHVDVMLSRRCNMLIMLHIIEENMPELLSLDLSNNKLCRLENLCTIDVKAPKLKILNLSNNSVKRERALDEIRSMKLEELWLKGNPLCQTFRYKSLYIRSVQGS
uniref:Nuclear RNA export factor Tap RNA-binding domain-containing protein n=1 Tax=Leptobrachium leishanense TaxID=445787 RepID=A0A8C5WKE9_9ANUR